MFTKLAKLTVYYLLQTILSLISLGTVSVFGKDDLDLTAMALAELRGRELSFIGLVDELEVEVLADVSRGELQVGFCECLSEADAFST